MKLRKSQGNGQKTPLGNAYPLRLTNADETAVGRVMRCTTLNKPAVMRLAIRAGLPIVRRRLASFVKG